MLILRDVPYLDAERRVRRGTLACPLALNGDIAIRPPDHVVRWVGEYPYDASGGRMSQLVANEISEEVSPGLRAKFNFSQKPPNGYDNYYEKLTRYVEILESQARAVDKDATANTWPPAPLDEDESVFCYLDTASGRSGISALSRRLARGKVAIVGLGGTGSYVLDFVAKTPVAQIHLFDPDTFQTHNAFRSPGAPSLDELRNAPLKVNRLQGVYSKMRRRIVPHEVAVNGTNLDQVADMEFVFICMDQGSEKQALLDFLVERRISFIDVGLGLDVEADTLDGLVRTTASIPDHSSHLATRVSTFTGPDGVYSTNIQVAELNAINAAMAVIKWKKLWGFYRDSAKELNSTYSISDNAIINDEQAA